jgi:MFS family permease
MSTATEGCTAPIELAAPARKRRVLSPTAAFAGAALGFAGLYLAAGAPTSLLVQYQAAWGFPAWMLTVAFAAYAFGLVAALLVTGSLSDIVGRRPVLIAALTVELAAMLVFVFAPNIGWVIAARVIQGVATGAATSAFTATLGELAPAKYRKLAAIIGGAAPAGGLGLGALFSGIAVQFTASASVIVFTVLAVIMALAAVVVIYSQETVTRRGGALRSLVPRVAVPRAARREFGAVIPVLLGSWMLAALFLGLVPTIIRTIFGIDSGLVNGVTVFIEPGAAAVAGFALGGLAARRTVVVGGITVFVGTAIIVAAIALHILPLIWLGAIIGGVGFGASFSGSIRILGPLAAPTHRAGLFAALFLVAYLSFGVPAIIVGQLVAPFGLLATILGFGAAILIASVVGILAQLRIARSSSASLESQE